MPDYLASNTDLGAWNEEQVFAGEADIVTEGGKTVVSGQNLARFTIVAYDAAGKLTKWDDTAVSDVDSQSDTVINLPTTVAKPVGILMHAVDATAADKTGAAILVGGVFNDAILVWPSDLVSATTLARQVALAKFGAPFRVAALG
jgi:hypothetical protein